MIYVKDLRARLVMETSASAQYYFQEEQQQLQQQQQQQAVDYSHHDFRESFAAIDQASRGAAGQFYPGGGVRVRREGDTQIVTEHRDPYSFYWQLDQFRRQEEEPRMQEENAIEEEIVHQETAA